MLVSLKCFFSCAPARLHHLGHQVMDNLTRYYERGTFAGQATKFRKGACKNCGAMTHTEKDCVERPRKVGAAGVPRRCQNACALGVVGLVEWVGVLHAQSPPKCHHGAKILRERVRSGWGLEDGL